jgi:hypothetical protein
MTSRISPCASADVSNSVLPGGPQTPAEASPDERLTPQISGQVNLACSEPEPMSEKPASGARVRVFICHECGIAEPVPWCGQSQDCGHPGCIDALERCVAPHRVDGRHFHGQVNVAIIERHLWARYEAEVAEEAR